MKNLLTGLIIGLVLLVIFDLFFTGNFLKRNFFTETVEVIREVEVEVPGPVREVIVEVEKEVIVEVIREVEVPGPVREVIVEVPVPTPTFTKTFGGEETEEADSVQQTADGGYIIAGRTESFGAGNNDAYLVKTDGEGNQEWYRTFGGEDDEETRSVQQTTDGGYIIAGRTWSFDAGDSDVYLVKTDGEGNEEWYRTFGGEATDAAYAVQQTADGGYIIAGLTWSFGAGGDVYLVKTGN